MLNASAASSSLELELESWSCLELVLAAGGWKVSYLDQQQL